VRQSNIKMKRTRPSLVVILLILLLLGIALDLWLWHELAARQRQSVASSQRPPAVGQLIEFGVPVPHEIIGPYHVLKSIGYVSGYDAGIQDPRWVETRFFAVRNPQSAARPEEFSPDNRIETQFRVTTDYWRDTGYDRGHMAPNWGVSICYGRTAQVESFLLSNVIPQSPGLNRGLWETLEKIISNDYAQRFGQVWVICGPEFPSNPIMLHDDLIEIPDKCFKIVLRVDPDGSPHTLAFEMPQNIAMGHRQNDLLQYLVPITQIEKDTGIEFFPELSEPTRSEVSRARASRLW
jgi:endonuclease G